MFMQDFLLTSSTSTMGTSSANATVEKLPNDERSSSRSRGWLNWLSLGMLGAGGTDDSGEFSGVVSDEVIKVFILLLVFTGKYCFRKLIDV